MNSNYNYFIYVSVTFFLCYCLNELSKRDPNKCKQLVKKINSGILKNFNESSTFWEKYQNPLEVVFKKIYDLFLKSNNQKKGIKSYSYVVALIVNYELQKNTN